MTPTLFARYPDAASYAAADREELETLIKSTGFFRAKTNSLMGLGRLCVTALVGRFRGDLKDLVTLPGVGRKTANVVLGNAFGVPGITVDTHFGRLARRFGWTEETDPNKVEAAVGASVPSQGLDRLVAPTDLARPPPLSCPQTRMRCLSDRPAVSGIRRRPHRSGRRGAAGQGEWLSVFPLKSRPMRAQRK